MPWNPDIYNKFKNERYEPFYDLLALIEPESNLKKVVDLGCGTGELTRKLSDHFPGAEVLGIDASSEMLAHAAAFANDQTSFEKFTIEDFIKDEGKYDLIFSNAALQWVDDHHRLFPAIIARINKGGQLAVQVPSNHHHFTHTVLVQLAGEEPWRTALGGWNRDISVLTIDEYARIFFDCGSSAITIFEKLYPHILPNADAVFEWVSGTAILRYLDRLPGNLKASFKEAYRQKIVNKYQDIHPVFYPFKRILMHVQF